MRTLASGRAILLLAIILLPGCRGEGMVAVKGKVLFDSEPVKDGSISFSPADGQGPTAGAIIKDGAYAAKVPAGKKRVEIRAAKNIGKGMLMGRMVDRFTEGLPAKYNQDSKLSADITQGMGDLNFDLSSK